MRYFSQDFKIFHNADKLAQRIFLCLSIVFVGFIVFPSSLIGLSQPHTFKSSLSSILLKSPKINEIYAKHDLGDLSTNVLFYIPFGLFLSLTVSFRKPRFFTFWLASGFVLSVSMEIAQYFVGRYPDPVDIITNTLGFIVGFELGVVAIRFFGLRPSAILGINPDNQTSTKINTIASLRFLYIAVYLFSSWLPFDLLFHWSEIVAKQQPDQWGNPKLILDPVFHFRHWEAHAEILAGLFWGVLPIGILTGILDGFKKNLRLSSSILMCLIVVVVSELGQLFVSSRTSDVFMIIISFMAGYSGWLVSSLWFRLQDTHGYSTFENERHRNNFIFSVLMAYVGMLVLSNLFPFRFEYSLKVIVQKLVYQTNWIPFYHQVGLRDIAMSFGLLKIAGAFIPFGLFVTLYTHASRPLMPRHLLMLLTGLSAIVLAVILEVVKSVGVGQYADTTYLLFACAGAIMGSVSYYFFAKVPERS